MTHGLEPTARQQEILRLAALGLPDKLIATELGVSYRTIRSHLERLATRVHRRTGRRPNRTALAVAWAQSQVTT